VSFCEFGQYCAKSGLCDTVWCNTVPFGTQKYLETSTDFLTARI